MKSLLVFFFICLPAVFHFSYGQICTRPGIIENPNVPNCKSFLWCVNFNATSFRENVFNCPPSRSFNPTIGRCEATYQCPSSTSASTTASSTATSISSTTASSTAISISSTTVKL